MTDTPRGGMSPVEQRERVAALDVLRGVAILGILVVNIELFRGPEYLLTFSGTSALSGPDALLSAVISAFAESKFITTLAFLFGLGFTLQGIRAEGRGRSANRLLARRMVVLLLFGVLHAVLIWSGDILLAYALIGFVFLLFYRCRPRTLLIWAGAALGIPLLLGLLLAALAFVTAALVGGAEAAGTQDAQLAFFQDFAQNAEAAYTSGSYSEMVVQRLWELLFMVPLGLFIFGPLILAMMLLGAAVARSGWISNLAEHRGGIRRAAMVGLGAGLPLNVFYVLSTYAFDPQTSAVSALGFPALILGAPLLAVGYISMIALLVLRAPEGNPGAVQRRLAAVGRIALTNYLTQSIVMTAIFYGFGLYGSVSLAAALLIGAALICAQLILSPVYLRKFSQGPAEWLWRRLTYGPTEKASS